MPGRIVPLFVYSCERRLYLTSLGVAECLMDVLCVLAAANPPRVIAASGTTVVDHVIPSLLANATQQLAPTQGNLTLTFESVER